MMGSSGGRLARTRRRALTIPAVCLTAVGVVAASLVWLPVLALSDWLRGARLAGVRCVAFLGWFAWCEMIGLAGAAATVLTTAAGSQRRAERLYRLQRGWSAAVFGGARRLFGFRLEVEDAAAAATAPVVLFLRHASMADTLLPSALFANPHGTRLRYVIKRELLVDPCLDVVGHLLPNYFVDRGSDDSAREIAAIRALAGDLGPGDGVLIYPEGTRFTPGKRRRIIERLRAAGDDARAKLAERLEHVLPPRRGGPLAVLEAARDVDVVVLAHTGFEAAATFPSLWRGDLVGRTIRIRLWRFARSEMPTDAADLAAWLDEVWLAVDRWIERVAPSAGPPAQRR